MIMLLNFLKYYITSIVNIDDIHIYNILLFYYKVLLLLFF